MCDDVVLVQVVPVAVSPVLLWLCLLREQSRLCLVIMDCLPCLLFQHSARDRRVTRLPAVSTSARVAAPPVSA